MNIFSEFRARVLIALEALTAEGVLPPNIPVAAIAVELPRDSAHGDLATNAAMALAKPAKMKPRDIADPLAEKLRADPDVASVDVAGPGFINMRLTDAFWRARLAEVSADPAGYGRSNVGAGRRVNVEFVSANPTGPMHVGHARGAVVGDALAGLLAFAGYDVTREYYINDGGSQVDVLARSAYLRYRQANGEAVEIGAGLYPGDYLVSVGAALKELHGAALMDAPEDDWLPSVRAFAIDRMMEMIRADLAALGVEMDVYFSEKSLYGEGLIEAALEALKAKDLVYQGVLEPPKGKPVDDWEPREQTLFRSTAYGDDVDRPVMKSDGSWTYFAPDIAYHYNKVERGFDQLINIFGADHGGYVKRMKAAVRALSGRNDDMLDIKLVQLVKLLKNGEPFKMSKRAGSFVTLRDMINEVGSDVARFVMLTRKNDQPLEFDFAKALEQSKDNPVYYVQYAHARARSTLRRAADAPEINAEGLANADLSPLAHPGEFALIRKIAEWPKVVESAAQAHEPHRIAFYLSDLASALHGYWHLGNEDAALRIVRPDAPEVSRARLALVGAASGTIAAGLGVLGVTPVEEMR